MKRKDFLKASGLVAAGLGVAGKLKAADSKNELSKSVSREYPFDLPTSPLICILVPSETLGPFPSLPSGDAMYWRTNIVDAMAGIPYTFTIKVFGTDNCGIIPAYRVDVWHCNAHGYYSHYASGGMNNGHSGQNSPGANNASLIYCRGTAVTDSNGEVTFNTIFPGWYPGRTWHIHFAIYHGGTVGTSNGWILDRVSQFTLPIATKNAVLTANAPYSSYGADPQSPDTDNVFNAPAGEWSNTQLATLAGSGAGPYSSYYEVAIDAFGVLSLTLLGFDGSLYGQGCLLRWRTENETNFCHFELEYSPDSDDFEFLARVEAKGNNAVTKNDYLYEDKDRLLQGNAFYRLKMVDIDGKYSYSSVVSIHNNLKLPIRIRTNPVTDNHLVLYHPLSTGNEKIMITDSIGRSIGVGKLSANVNYTQIDLGLCGKGIHFLIYSDGKYTQTLKFLIQ
ncbi:MAG: T9SS type A sorting domain-containing protein [Ferruginibacter sp.]